MISFGGDSALKARLQANIERHLQTDTLVQGLTGQDDKGCSVWCSAGYYDHARAAEEYLLPEWLWRLNDTLFEGMTASDALQFPAQLWAAIPVGIDLEPVQWRLAILRHERQLEALASNPEAYARQVEGALRLTIDYCHLAVRGQTDEAARAAAWLAARTAAESAAGAAADSAAWSAWSAWSAARTAAEALAWSSAEAAARSARSAAESVAGPAAWAARAYFEWEADTLLRLLKEEASRVL